MFHDWCLSVEMIYRFNVVPIKIPTEIFGIDIDKHWQTLKFIWKGKGNKWTKTILIKKRLKWEESVYPLSRLILFSYGNQDYDAGRGIDI